MVCREILLFVLFVIIVGKLTGRLLGVRLGRWRGALVGAIGWVAGAIAAAFTIGDVTTSGATLTVHGFDEWVATVTVVIFFGVLAAMPVAIGLDLLTRSGSDRPGRRPRCSIRSARPRPRSRRTGGCAR